MMRVIYRFWESFSEFEFVSSYSSPVPVADDAHDPCACAADTDTVSTPGIDGNDRLLRVVEKPFDKCRNHAQTLLIAQLDIMAYRVREEFLQFDFFLQI